MGKKNPLRKNINLFSSLAVDITKVSKKRWNNKKSKFKHKVKEMDTRLFF